jgi:quercetin dioxygenase-like cupin family protein
MVKRIAESSEHGTARLGRPGGGGHPCGRALGDPEAEIALRNKFPEADDPQSKMAARDRGLAMCCRGDSKVRYLTEHWLYAFALAKMDLDDFIHEKIQPGLYLTNSSKKKEEVVHLVPGHCARMLLRGRRMPFVNTNQLRVVERLPGWHGRYFHSPNMTFAHYDFRRGASIHEHFHPQEEVYEVIEGKLEVTIDGVAQVVEPGLVAIVPSNVRHSVKALTDGRAIIVDWPIRPGFE